MVILYIPIFMNTFRHRFIQYYIHMTDKKLILASTSKGRQAVLKNAGIWIYDTINANINEDIYKSQGLSADILAKTLSYKKALAVSKKYPEIYVIGGDQTLSLQGNIFHKPDGIHGLKTHLQAFSGKKHTLHTGLAVAHNGHIVFDGVWHAHMYVRVLSQDFIEWYADTYGQYVLSSVGGYHFESMGIQLFERVDGDIFTIMGLPLIPLCEFLRECGCLKS